MLTLFDNQKDGLFKSLESQARMETQKTKSKRCKLNYLNNEEKLMRRKLKVHLI